MKEIKKLCIAFIGISFCFIILYLLSKYNDNIVQEGFLTLSAVTYSDTIITAYNDYQNKLIEDSKASGKSHNVVSVDDLQKLGVPETDVNTFISTGLWPWSDGFTEAVKKTEINTANNDPTTITNSINDAQKQYPEQFYITFFSGIFDIGFATASKSKNIGCNIDPVSKKSTGDTMFTLDNNGLVTTTSIPNEQLPTLIPGFTFLDQPCNPCNIYNRTYNCPFALPDSTGAPLFPGFIMEYAWNSNSNTTTEVNQSINSLSSGISSLF